MINGSGGVGAGEAAGARASASSWNGPVYSTRVGGAEMSIAQAGVIGRTGRAPVELEQPVEEHYEYPGIPTTCDGAEAVVHVETRISQGAGAYPITSSTTMGRGFNPALMNRHEKLWGGEAE